MLESELKYRCSDAYDFVVREMIHADHWHDFFDSKQSAVSENNFTFKLLTISQMLQTSTVLGRRLFRNTAIREFDKMSRHFFSVSNRKFILKPNEQVSQAQWNAVAAIILHKLDQKNEGKQFLNSVILSLQNYMNMSKKDLRIHHLGVVTIALMMYEEFAYAQSVIDILKNDDHFMYGPDVWILSVDGSNSPRVEAMEKEFKAVDPQWLTTPMIATLQHIHLSRGDMDSFKEWVPLQFARQITADNAMDLDKKFSGSYVSGPHNKEIRLDYLWSTQSSFLVYLFSKDTSDPNALLSYIC